MCLLGVSSYRKWRLPLPIMSTLYRLAGQLLRCGRSPSVGSKFEDSLSLCTDITPGSVTPLCAEVGSYGERCGVSACAAREAREVVGGTKSMMRSGLQTTARGLEPNPHRTRN
jgi:hypothetical protein